jgi:hypothetical protein
MARKPNELVEKLAKAINPPSPDAKSYAAGSPDALAASSNTPQIVAFVGYLGATVTYDGGDWRVLYLDAELRDCLLVDDQAILHNVRIKPPDAPPDGLDVIWVRGDTPVCRASGSESAEAQFLTGEFTRAGDFEAGPTGGTLSASTGVFCEARSPGCCRCTVYTR